MKRLSTVIISVIATLVLLTGVLQSAPQPITADDEGLLDLTQIELPPKGNPKLDSALNKLIPDTSTPEPAPLIASSTPEFVEETVRVIIESAPGKVDDISSAAGGLGSIEGSNGDLVQMVVPVSQLTALAEMPDVRFVRLPMEPLPAITSEGVAVINADDWQAASYNGTGVKIGILDVGFGGYPTLLGSELPTSVTVRSFYAGGNIEGRTGYPQPHGTACAEIVYDIAPGATYYFTNFGTDVEYGNAVDWLIAQGVNVISCSVGWPVGGPGDGTGYFCQVVDSARAAGVLWVQAAGNQAQMHWEGTWSNPDSDIWHNFSGADEGNTITVDNGELIVEALKWDDPWYSSSNDYDLLLYDNTGALVAYSLNIQNGDDDPYEILAYVATYTGTYDVAIGTLGSPAVVNFHLYSYYQDLQYQTPSGSLLVPADSFSNMAAGAVNYATPTTLESFSSRGPTNDGRIKPDIVAPDGVSTRSYASYSPPTFSGTSAAAPHAAGAAALVKQRYPTYTPAQIQAVIEGGAAELGTTGKDNLYGSGRLNLGSVSSNCTLTMAIGGSGNVTPALGTHSYAEGSTVDITATAASGWQFVKWTDNVADPCSANTTVLMDTDRTVIATFFQPMILQIEALSSTHNEGDYISLDLDSFGNPHISYVTPGNEPLKYCYWNGSSWQYQNVADSLGIHRRFTSLKLDQFNYPHISYQEYSAADLMYASWDGSNWIIETADNIGGPGFYSSLALDSNGQPHISHYNMSNYDLEYTYKYGSGWHSEIVDHEGYVGAFSSIALDSMDYPHISYWDSTRLKYAYWDGSIWHFVIVDSNVITGKGTSLVLDSSDRPHISYYDESNNKLKYAHWNGVAWQIETIDSGGSYSSIALDSNGYPAIAYYSGKLKFAHWNGSAWDTEIIDNTGDSGRYCSLSVQTSVLPNVYHVSYNSIADVIRLMYAKITFIPVSATTVQLAVAVNGSGVTTPSIGTHTYSANSKVNITATPSANWEFVNWTGDVAEPDSAHTTVTMNTGKTVTANFNRINSVLRVTANGGGNITPVLGNHVYPIGATVNITAIPAVNWAFVNWTGDVADVNSASTNVTMNWDKTVTANFIRTHSTLTIAIHGSGNVTPEAGIYTYPVGTTANITATPASGYRFVNWTGDVSTIVNVNSASTNITMNRDYTITANFATIRQGGGGGGGGGGGSSGVTSLIEYLNSDGKFTVSATAESTDGLVKISIPKDTIGKNRNGQRLSFISIKELKTPPAAPADSTIIGRVYDVGPSGATFDPPITLTIRYKDTALPEGTTESNLYMATWDMNTETYIPVDCQVDKEANVISASVSHFSRYTILSAPRPAQFTLSDLTINPAQVNKGEEVTVSVIVSNTGSLSGNYSAILEVNNIVKEIKEVAIAGDERVTLTFNTIGEDAGIYNVKIGNLEGTFNVEGSPATFEISSLTISPAEVDIGKIADISVTVTNKGQTTGTYEVKLNVNGSILDKKEVSLAGGESQQVGFTFTADTAGKKIIDVNGIIGGLIVRGEVPPPEQIPLPMEESQPAPEVTTPSEPESTLPVEQTATSGINWILIFGVTGGCLVLAACLYYFTYWRRRVKNPTK